MAVQDSKPTQSTNLDITSDSKTGSFVWRAPANWKPKKPTQPKPATKPTEPKTQPVQPKEVKTPVARDPKGMFDYSGCKTYVVQRNDDLYSIAQKYVVALQQLRYFNHLDKQDPKVKEGQTLYIPKEPINVPYGK